MKNKYHTTVLLQEAIDALQVKKGNKYIDATLGGGGHTFEILERGGDVLSLDVDEDALNYVSEQSKNQKSDIENKKNLKVVRGNFRNIQKIAQDKGFGKVSGVLFDLGTSVHQLKEANRGFSFSEHSRLDMRMDKNLGLSAYEIVNDWPRSELINIFEKFGEEHEAVRIATQIVERRERQKIEFSDELAEIVREVKREKEREVHPATKVFQALRIAVNDELQSLSIALRDSVDLLESGGRMVVITFHSLEDRIVKLSFLEFDRKGYGENITKKPIVPNEKEVQLNKKSRSAKLRIFEKK